MANKNEEVIAKREKNKKKNVEKTTDPEKMEEEIKEFDENEYRETVKLNELMQDLKLEETNEEDELKNLDEVMKDFHKIEISKKQV